MPANKLEPQTDAIETSETVVSPIVALVLDPSRDRPKRNGQYRFPTRIAEVSAKISSKKNTNNELVLQGDFLNDGTNFVTRESLDAMRQNPWFARCVNMGVVTIVEPIPGAGSGTTLDYQEEDAELLIDGSPDIEWLERCLMKEDRPRVANLCSSRIQDIKDEIEASKKEQGE